MRHAVPAIVRNAACVALAALLVATSAAPLAAAGAGGTQISHSPIKYFVAGKRIRLEATVKDPDGVAAVRCYFRAVGRGDFVFTTMEAGKGGSYRALLPAPVATTSAIQYRIQAVNLKGKTAKTATFSVDRKDDTGTPLWQEVATDEAVRIGESGSAGAPDGFADATARTAGKPSSNGSSSAARSAGAAKSGLSTGAWIGIGAGAVAVGAGAVVLATGGDDGAPKDVNGTWDMHLRCAGQGSDTSVVRLTINQAAGGSFDGSGSGTDYPGTPMQHQISGTYDAGSHLLSATLTTRIQGQACVRRDKFSTTLTSNDSGYVGANQVSNCGGCQAEVRMVRQ